ncbi:long-chain acyl-CoA synthetase [Donghicola tyrosinivorans]|uniref:Long-chain acyl-CoA synthetase n=1 Tax=Donghicola tyrosinivorans TaxID=1652492 RepID=A0A2T0WEV4_9RHOB|nr:long-chain acyl-CoA synthetase [Donghicola tyrosinivorans]
MGILYGAGNLTLSGHNVLNFIDCFDNAAKGFSEASLFLKTEKYSLNRKTFNETLRRMFTFYEQLGLKTGDRIGVLSREPADVSALVLSAMRAGIGVVVINPEMTDGELERAQKACGLAHLFHEVDPTNPRVLPDGLAVTHFTPWGGEASGGGLLGRLRRKQSSGQAETLQQMLAGVAPKDPPAEIAPDTLALMLYTSGTTSQPKVVQLTHANISAQFDIFDQVYDYSRDSRILNPLPMHFTDGMCHGPLITFLKGATLYRPREFDITQLEDLLIEVYREKITHLIVVPAILALMDRMGSEYLDTFKSPHFRYIRSSGDRLPTALWESIEARYGTRVVNTYGMSETVCEATFSGPSDELRKVGTIGKAVGVEWKIVDEEGNSLSTGETGELLLKGPLITKGYRDQPELTAAAIQDGWLRTGDLATADADGFVTIAGRQKDLIISGGVNIQPQEITDCLLACEGIADAIAFGLPHGVWGEQVAAAIVLDEDVQMDQAAVIQYCAKHLTAHKLPRIVSFVDALPRNPAGKVLVKQLRSESHTMDLSSGSVQESAIADAVLSTAAQTFGVPVDELHLSSEPATTRGWDSFAHLTLVTALEANFDTTFSAQEILRISNLSALVDLLAARRSVPA